jgi:hypothetical protein
MPLPQGLKTLGLDGVWDLFKGLQRRGVLRRFFELGRRSTVVGVVGICGIGPRKQFGSVLGIPLRWMG